MMAVGGAHWALRGRKVLLALLALLAPLVRKAPLAPLARKAPLALLARKAGRASQARKARKARKVRKARKARKVRKALPAPALFALRALLAQLISAAPLTLPTQPASPVKVSPLAGQLDRFYLKMTPLSNWWSRL